MNKKGLVWGLLALSFIAVFVAIPLVSAERSVGQYWLDKLGLSKLDSSLNIITVLGITPTTLAQFLIFVLVALVIYAIAPFLPFVGEKPWVTGAISIVVALLSSIFLTSQEVNSIVLSYNALGLVITGIIPFFAIAAIAKRSYDKQHYLFAWIIWVAFIVLMVYRWITADVNDVGPFGRVVLPIILILSFLMLFFQGKIYLFLFKRGIRAGSDYMRETGLAEQTARLDELADKIRAAKNDTERNLLIAEFDREVKLQNKMGGNYHRWGG